MAKILLIETATEVCSVALSDGGAVIHERESPPPSRHASLLTPMILDALAAAGWRAGALDAVCVSAGPGSYTGLRVGASVAKGMCYALDIPLLAVDTLYGLAWGMRAAGGYPADAVWMPMLDARRNEVWTAVYSAGLDLLKGPQPLLLENILFEKFLSDLPDFACGLRAVLGGNGSVKEGIGGLGEYAAMSPVKTCAARHLAAPAEAKFQHADFVDIAYFEPDYMKPPNITVSKKT